MDWCFLSRKKATSVTVVLLLRRQRSLRTNDEEVGDVKLDDMVFVFYKFTQYIVCFTSKISTLSSVYIVVPTARLLLYHSPYIVYLEYLFFSSFYHISQLHFFFFKKFFTMMSWVVIVYSGGAGCFLVGSETCSNNRGRWWRHPPFFGNFFFYCSVFLIFFFLSSVHVLRSHISSNLARKDPYFSM